MTDRTDTTAQQGTSTNENAPSGPVTNPQGQPDPMTDPNPQTGADGDDSDQGNRRRDLSAEAATYRRRARDAEAERDAAITERDAAQTKLTAVQRREVERVLDASPTATLKGTAGDVQSLIRPADLWEALGAGYSDFHDPDTGDLDEVRLADYIAERTRGRGYYQRPRFIPVTPSDIVANLTRPRGGDADAGTAWQAALSGS